MSFRPPKGTDDILPPASRRWRRVLAAFDNGDFPQLMPFMVIIVTAVIMFNLLADVSYAWLDPRIRLD